MLTLEHEADRRQFLSRTAAALAAMHAPFLLGCDSPQTDFSDVAPVRFKRLVLETQPLDAMRVFYTETLGFPLAERDADSFAFEAGDSEVEFRQSRDSTDPFYHFAFSIAENKIESAKEWTESRTKVLSKSFTGKQIIHFRNWDADAIYFQDPAGNIGEFIAHHTLPTARSGGFSLDDVLYASEIGLVVDDTRKAVKEIEPLTGVQKTQNVSRNFAAIGDARGYFILVPKGRVWLPTNDVKAVAHVVNAQFQSHASGTSKLDCGPFTLERTAG